MAISVAVQSRLANVEGLVVVERERLQEVLHASGVGPASDPPDTSITPRILGVDHVLIGSVQLIGDWSDTSAKIRVAARIVSAEPAQLSEDASFVLDGTVGTLFDVESDLARKLVEATGQPVATEGLPVHEARNLKAKQLFGQGLLRLHEAEGITSAHGQDLPPRQARTGVEPSAVCNRLFSPGAAGQHGSVLQSSPHV